MRLSVVSLTENGRLLSMKIKDIFDREHAVMRYCFKSHFDEKSIPFDSIYTLTERIFGSSDAVIFVCACGIAVRAIAPHIKSKTADPAVIVIDDCGKFVVPILSGHLGGANRISRIIAEKLGAAAAITTATDTGGRFSPDCFAAANKLIISDIETAKKVASAVLDGEKIGFFSDFPHSVMPAELSADMSCRIGICVSRDTKKKPFETTLNLAPKNIIVGIGCKRGARAEIIEETVAEAFKSADIDISRIYAVSTIDIKAHEKGLVEFCEKNGIPLRSFSADELMSVEGDFSASEFVLKTTGADNVCERSAVLCSGGSLVIRKRSGCGVTAAAAEMPIYIDFEGEIL